MKKPELLAPVGNIESLIAAIEAGCDAVYLSGKLYGARSFAGNFDSNELINALNYAHKYYVKVYVTVNTLIYESEVNNFIKYIDFLYINGVDAIIIQDIGMFDLVRKLYPNLEIHVSTQMHIHNLEGCKFVEHMGAKRTVLARETPIELVKKIKDNVNIQLEIFVHGALCVSYSGQCLMSSLIGGRSGNRGTCAQCCRQPYDMYMNDKKINTNKYLLSTRDLNVIDEIGTLIDIGVDSLKIEGRMKRPEYVYLIVSLYRKAIDNYINIGRTNITNDDIKEIKKVFNRNFTKGFLFNTNNDDFINDFRPNHQGIEIGKVIKVYKNRITIKLTDDLNIQDGIRFIGKEDIGLTIQKIKNGNNKIIEAHKDDIITIYNNKVPSVNDIVVKTTDYNQIRRINNLINSNLRNELIDISFTAHKKDRLKIVINDTHNNIVEEYSEFIVDESINNPTTKENIFKQLSKLGNTIFSINKIDINVDNNCFIPIKYINELRRNALDKLIEIRLKKKDIIYGKYSIEVPNFDYENKKSIYLNDISSIYKYIYKYDEVVVDYDNNISTTMNRRIKLPRVQEYLKDINGSLLVGELGSIYKYCNEKNNISTDFSLNVTNSYSVALLHSLGVDKVTLSIEMNDFQISKLIKEYHKRYNKHPNLEVIVSDIPEAMIIKYDIFNGKYNSNNKYYLKDKYNNKFSIIRKNNLTYIYNYKRIVKNNYNDYYDMGVNWIRENSIIL